MSSFRKLRGHASLSSHTLKRLGCRRVSGWSHKQGGGVTKGGIIDKGEDSQTRGGVTNKGVESQRVARERSHKQGGGVLVPSWRGL